MSEILLGVFETGTVGGSISEGRPSVPISYLNSSGETSQQQSATG
mgnify:CR=1 FL=1